MSLWRTANVPQSTEPQLMKAPVGIRTTLTLQLGADPDSLVPSVVKLTRAFFVHIPQVLEVS